VDAILGDVLLLTVTLVAVSSSMRFLPSAVLSCV
jgi:hypothetical protein